MVCSRVFDEQAEGQWGRSNMWCNERRGKDKYTNVMGARQDRYKKLELNQQGRGNTLSSGERQGTVCLGGG